MPDAHLVPGIRVTLWSVPALCPQGHSVRLGLGKGVSGGTSTTEFENINLFFIKETTRLHPALKVLEVLLLLGRQWRISFLGLILKVIPAGKVGHLKRTLDVGRVWRLVLLLEQFVKIDLRQPLVPGNVVRPTGT